MVEELRRCGVGFFCLSPGARAIPLVLALEDNPAVVMKLFNDERSAAFWAQGAAKGGVLPCLVCTSGTAATNYLPAVAEASLAGTPLLVLTTDRPFELHYAKANQTLPQRDLFAPFAQATFEIPAPERQLFPACPARRPRSGRVRGPAHGTAGTPEHGLPQTVRRRDVHTRQPACRRK